MAKKTETAEATETTESVATETTETKSSPLDIVELEIPISEQEQDDWFCCVNGRTFQIQRGETVKVPRYVKEIYENEKNMKQLKIKRSQALQEKLAKKEKLAFS